MAGNLDRAIYDIEGEEAGNKHIPSGGSPNQALVYSSNGTAVWGDLPDASVTNLTYTSAASTGDIESSTGTNATIPAVTTSIAGLMTAADKTTLDGIVANTVYDTAITIEAGVALEDGGGFTANQATPGTITLNHKTTAGFKHIPSGGSSEQVLVYSADGTAIWDDLPDASATNLTYVSHSTTGEIESSTGSDVILPAATSSIAGVMTAADKVVLDELNTIVEW